MLDEQSDVRLAKLKNLEELGVEIYPYSFDRSHEFKDLVEKYKTSSHEALAAQEHKVKIAGRVLAVRKMGKSAFLHLFDGEVKLQVYIRSDVVSEKDFQVFKLLDLGDLIGVEGKLFRTRTNELTVLVSGLTFLAKALHPLPEKWHGLQDKELRFRQRYLDLVVNEGTREIFNLRSLLIQQIRMFFYERGYLEVETPMMHPIPGGASAKPFITRHNALVGGMEKVFEVNRNFRNEGISQKHNPEFTMLEFYELYKDFNDYMKLTEDLIRVLNKNLANDQQIRYEDKTICLEPPFKRVKYMDLICQQAGISLEDLWEEAKLKAFIQEHIPAEELPPTYGKMLELMFDHYVEESLQNPTFVTYYPKAISPLSKRSRLDERETERFELYIAGMEVANGFSELNDPVDQRNRFEAQVKDREKGDEEAQVIDEDFLTALEYGMAPAAGEGVGIDRLVMLYSGTNSIKEVILFPLLRPKAVHDSTATDRAVQ